jgi:DNA adenine methylase
MNPIVKWVGGKRKLAPYIAPRISAYLKRTNGTYFEPFFGGGAVGLMLHEHEQLIFSDMNAELISMYRWVCDQPQLVWDALDALIRQGVDSDAYYRVRDGFAFDAHEIDRAARVLYLNKLCFNGLWRENKQGKFNVPYGSYKKPSFATAEELLEFSKKLRHAVFVHADAFEMIEKAQFGDLIYADSPYDDTFDGYTAGMFPATAQVKLAEALHAAVERGVYVIASNADTVNIRRLYKPWAKIETQTERRSVNSDADGRGPVGTVLIEAAGMGVAAKEASR